MKTQEQEIIDLIRKFPELVLTGSRYFGTSNLMSDWDFILPLSRENELPLRFALKPEPKYTDLDPFIVRVYESRDQMIHIQIVSDRDLKLKIRAQEILKDTNALVGLEKPQQARVWRSMLLALSDIPI